MNTTHDDDATTWRDLADQLTPEQVAELEYCEQHQIPPGMRDPQQGQLNAARAMARRNILQALCADIPPPVGGVGTLCEWEERHGERYGDADRYGRMFISAEWTVGDNTVSAVGVQFDDGTIDRSILLNQPEEVTAADARALAAALVEAADELDRLEGNQPA